MTQGVVDSKTSARTRLRQNLIIAIASVSRYFVTDGNQLIAVMFVAGCAKDKTPAPQVPPAAEISDASFN